MRRIRWGGPDDPGRHRLGQLYPAGLALCRSIAANAGHFLRASLPAALLYLLLGQLQTSPAAIGYALTSGALASGLGYALWYLVLPHLGRTLAASVQLLVPLLAALAGLIWLDESWSLRLLLSSLGILGIALVIGTPPSGEKP